MSLQSFRWTFSQRLIEKLWDTWCLASIIGIWPRFIEPKLLCTSTHTLPISTLPKEFDGLRVVQISDLHYSCYLSPNFLKRIVKRVEKLKPDLIVFTGDLISYSELIHQDELEAFLKALKAPLGCFAIFGNHDYSQYVSLADDGSYRIVTQHVPAIMKGFSRLFSGKEAKTEDILVQEPIKELESLKKLYQAAGVTLLHNETVQIGRRNSKINLTGLGDLIAQQFLPFKAFSGYDPRFPGIVLSHNPDSYDVLQRYPGDLLLFGHTHGGQVNLPYIWEKITPIKDKRLKSGLFYLDNRFLYVNRGLGATFPFRWFAPPEISLFILMRQGPIKSPVWQSLSEPERVEEEGVLGTSSSYISKGD